MRIRKIELGLLLLLLAGIALGAYWRHRDGDTRPDSEKKTGPTSAFAIQGATFGTPREKLSQAFGEGEAGTSDGEPITRYKLPPNQAQDAFEVCFSQDTTRWIFGPTVEREGKVLLQLGEPAERVVAVLGTADAERPDPHWRGLPGWYTYGNLVIRCQYYHPIDNGWELSSSGDDEARLIISGFLLVPDPAAYVNESYQEDLQGDDDPNEVHIYETIKSPEPGLSVTPL